MPTPLTIIEPRLRKNIDKTLLFAVVALMALSLLTIHNATTAQGGWGSVVRQGVYFLLGIGLMAWASSKDYSGVTRYATVFYWANIILLIFVLKFSPDVKGASRWIRLPIPGMDFKLQPSEFAKISIILTLSAYVAQLGPKLRELPSLLMTLLHVGIPMLLIAKQPDLGTALVFLAVWTGIVFLGGADWRHLVGLAVVGSLLFGVAWKANILHNYQKDRVLTFLNPTRDPRNRGYHVLQSLTAIGGGGATGQGFGKGIQTKGDFIPENHTDFIFTVVGEEGGFVGACLLLSIYGLILWRGVATIAECEEPMGRLIAGGITTLIAFHLTVNIGMTCGIMPVVGVPLPLMSFGGSAAMATLLGIGLLLSIHMRRHKISF
ncbi:MAG: rod shape-determining protein RodA [Cytophagales bacterium]|nr:rod shape-determining protein RodA [Armatimonadota bacterium]